jgi:hypothetical protein
VTKPRPRREREAPEIDGVSWRYLNDATTDEDRRDEAWLLFTLEFNMLPVERALESNGAIPVVDPPTGKSTEELWAEYGEDIVKWWIKDRPGTRPSCWWRYSYSAPDPHREAPDPEAQTAILKQHDLLLPGEAARIPLRFRT